MNVKKEYGYVLFVALLFYLTQQLLMILPVMKERSATNIKAPTLYPRDSEIKNLGLTDEQVLNYYRAQRVHQNNVEVMSVFMPLFLIAGFFEPTKVAIAGLVVLVFRIVGGIGYLSGNRMYGAPWHLGELYLLYIVGSNAYKLLFKKSSIGSGAASTASTASAAVGGAVGTVD
tara:strand:+ start:234 stop:752 length:519 start_codon:yes stop_codon:yes gene_type:complete